MKILLLLSLLLGFSVPAIAHNEFNGGEFGNQGIVMQDNTDQEGAETEEGGGVDFKKRIK